MKNRLKKLIQLVPDDTLKVKKDLYAFLLSNGFELSEKTFYNYINLPESKIDGRIVSKMLVFFNSKKKGDEQQLTLDDFYEKDKKKSMADKLGLVKGNK